MLPRVLEFGYIRKDLVTDKSKIQLSLEYSPQPTLDKPNCGGVDINVDYWPFYNEKKREKRASAGIIDYTPAW